MKHEDSMKRVFRILVRSVALLLLFAPAYAAETAEEGKKTTHPIEGYWRWNFTMPDGATTRPKLILTMRDGRLSGTSSFRPGSETAITNAGLNGDELSFQVVRAREGQDIVTTYRGRWSGKEIKGTVESNWAGEKQTYDWTAQRAHVGAEGTWQWTNYFGGRTGRGFVMKVDLEQSGDILSGSMPGFRGGRRTEIRNGTIKNGELYFETERTFEDTIIVTKYSGKQTGDVIKGTIESTGFDGQERKDEWRAKRVD